MANTEKALRISLRPELQRYVREKVEAGEYDSADDVVNGALALLRRQEKLSAADLAELREMVAVGVAQAAAGDFTNFDAESVIAEGTAILKRASKKAKR